jgi:hypothetical protein
MYRQRLAYFALDHGASFVVVSFDQGEIIDAKRVIPAWAFAQFKTVVLRE